MLGERLREHTPSTSRPQLCRVCHGSWPCEAEQALELFAQIAEMAHAHSEADAHCRNAMTYILARCP